MEAALLRVLPLVLACSLAGCASPPSCPPEPLGATIDFAGLVLLRGKQPEKIELFQQRLERDATSRLESRVALALLARAGRDPDAAEEHLALARSAAGDAAPGALRGWMDYATAALALDRNHPEQASELAEQARRRLVEIGDQRGVVEATVLQITARGL
jgi:hypothetical protein